MKIYSIVFNSCPDNSYDGFIVVAKDKKDVITVIRETYSADTDIDWGNGYIIKEVKPTRRRVVFESFRGE